VLGSACTPTVQLAVHSTHGQRCGELSGASSMKGSSLRGFAVISSARSCLGEHNNVYSSWFESEKWTYRNDVEL